MPQIKEYNSAQVVDTQPLDQAAYHVERSGYIRGAAMRQMGEQVAGAIGEAEQHVAQSEISNLSKGISDLDMQATQAYEQAKQNGDPTDPNFAGKFVEQNLQPQLEKMGDGLLTRQAKTFYQDASQRITQEYYKRGVADQATFAGDAAVANWKSTLTSYANIATTDPTSVDHAASMVEALAPSLPAEHRAALVDGGLETIYTAGAVSYMDAAIRNPKATAETLDQAWQHVADPKNKFVEHVNPDTFRALDANYMKAKQGLAADQTEIAKLQWPKILTAVREGDPSGADAAQSFISSFAGKTAGETQVGRAKYAMEFQDAAAQGEQARKYGEMPQPEIDAQMPALTSQALAGDKTAKYALASIKDRNARFAADPAGFMVGSDPLVKARYAAMFDQQGKFTGDPAAMAAYMTATAGAQKRLYPSRAPQLLTQPMMAPIQNAVRGISQNGTGAEQAEYELQRYGKTFGPYWPNVASELMTRHAINGDQYVASMLYGSPEAAALATPLLSASTMTNAQRFDLHGITGKAADAAAAQAFDPFNRTLANIPGSASTIAAYTSALSHLIQSKGINPSDNPDLVTKLANDMLGGEYDIRDGTLRLPAKGVDADAIETSAVHFRTHLNPEDIDYPPTMQDTPEKKQAYLQSLEQTARWYTTPDHKGATLYPSEGAGTPVLDHGVPVTFTWDQLAKMEE